MVVGAKVAVSRAARAATRREANPALKAVVRAVVNPALRAVVNSVAMVVGAMAAATAAAMPQRWTALRQPN